MALPEPDLIAMPEIREITAAVHAHFVCGATIHGEVGVGRR